jgi:tRNA(Ile)-lysidine synthase TilS/MesJ
MGEAEAKERRLLEQLREVPSLVVAYSGGVDSAYLAYAAHQALGDRMLAVTALSASYSERDRQEAQAVVARFKLPHEFIATTNSRTPPIAPTILTAATFARMNCLTNSMSSSPSAASLRWLMALTWTTRATGDPASAPRVSTKF